MVFSFPCSVTIADCPAGKIMSIEPKKTQTPKKNHVKTKSRVPISSPLGMPGFRTPGWHAARIGASPISFRQKEHAPYLALAGCLVYSAKKAQAFASKEGGPAHPARLAAHRVRIHTGRDNTHTSHGMQLTEAQRAIPSRHVPDPCCNAAESVRYARPCR